MVGSTVVLGAHGLMLHASWMRFDFDQTLSTRRLRRLIWHNKIQVIQVIRCEAAKHGEHMWHFGWKQHGNVRETLVSLLKIRVPQMGVLLNIFHDFIIFQVINNLDDWCSPLGNLWKPPVPHSCPGFGAMCDLQRHVGVFEDRHRAARLQGCKAARRKWWKVCHLSMWVLPQSQSQVVSRYLWSLYYPCHGAICDI